MIFWTYFRGGLSQEDEALLGARIPGFTLLPCGAHAFPASPEVASVENPGAREQALQHFFRHDVYALPGGGHVWLSPLEVGRDHSRWAPEGVLALIPLVEEEVQALSK